MASSSYRLEWHGEEAKVYVRRKTVKGMRIACEAMVERARELLSVPVGTGTYGEIIRSEPGEPPRMETTWLRESVTYDIDEDRMEAWVGTALLYGMYLELGTRRGIEPRPWLRPAAATIWNRITEFFRWLSD